MMENNKLVCKECGWKGDNTQVLVGINPFDKNVKIWGCPQCQSIDSMRSVCDETDCWEEISCGTPTKDGYRSTCSKHKPPHAPINHNQEERFNSDDN